MAVAERAAAMERAAAPVPRLQRGLEVVLGPGPRFCGRREVETAYCLPQRLASSAFLAVRSSHV